MTTSTASLPSARLLNAEQAAAYLNVPVSWLREATRSGRIAHVRLGKHRRYLLEDLDEWIRERRVHARP